MSYNILLLIAGFWFGMAVTFAGMFLWQREQTMKALIAIDRLVALSQQLQRDLDSLKPLISEPKSKWVSGIMET